MGVPPFQRKQVPEKENKGRISCRAGGGNKLFRVASSQRDCSEGGPGAQAGAEEGFAGVGEGGVGAVGLGTRVKPQ